MFFENLPFELKENEGRDISLKRNLGVGRLKELQARLRAVFTKGDSCVWELMAFIPEEL